MNEHIVVKYNQAVWIEWIKASTHIVENQRIIQNAFFKGLPKNVVTTTPSNFMKLLIVDYYIVQKFKGSVGTLVH